MADPRETHSDIAGVPHDAAAEAKRMLGIALAVGSAVVAFVAGILGWQSLKSSVSPPSSVAARPVAEIAQEAGRALGRVEAYDLSGQVTPLGFGAAIEAGSMAVACPTLEAGAQIKVHNGPRAVSARVTHKDESLGLCRLAVEGSGAASPLAVAPMPPVAGETVFAATLDAAGDARLAQGKVKRVWTEGVRTLIEATGAAPGTEGAVLLDAAGRVLGAAPVAATSYYAVTRAFATQKPSGS